MRPLSKRLARIEPLESRLVLSTTDLFSASSPPPVHTNLGIGPGLHREGLSLAPEDDQDWYGFKLLKPDSIEVEVQHGLAAAGVTLEIYDANFTLLGTSQTDNDREVVSLSNLGAGYYLAHVVGDAESIDYELAVEPGPTSETRVIYVSREDGHNRDESYYSWTTGDDANDGLTPQTPKASLQSVLDAYDLGPNDLVVFETGVYASSAVITPEDAGATYVGTVAGSYLGQTTLDGADGNLFYSIGFGSPDGGVSPAAPSGPSASPIPAHVMLVDADDNVFERVTFSTPTLNVSLELSDRNLFQNSEFTGTGGGMHMPVTGNALNRILQNTWESGFTALRIDTLAFNSVLGNTITGPGGIGIQLSPGVTSLVTGNDISGRDVGIYSDSTVADMYGNLVHDNTIGIASRQGVIGPANPPPFDSRDGKTPDKVYNNDTGVLIHEDAAGVILRFTEIYDNDIGVEALGDRSRIIANDIHDNGIGIRGSEVIGPEAWETQLHNLVHHNDVGIETLRGAEARYNHIYLNTTGVKISGNSFVHHNLIYRNTGHGVLVSGAAEAAGTESGHGLLHPGINLDGNTIYAPGGNGIHLQGFLRNVRIRNNIVLAESGYAFYVSPESQLDPRTGLAAYSSDYNDYFATRDGKVAFQGKDFDDLFDWQVEAESDLHSLGRTSIDPTRDDPLFVNFAADDYHVLAGSPTIDAGDPTGAFSQEPGPNGNRVNLGAYGNTPQAAVSPASWLRLTYPEFYVDLRSTVSHPINWEAYNVPDGTNLRIELVQDGLGTVRTIAASVPASAGTFAWTPSMFPGIANNFGIRHRVQITTTSGPTLTDSSREPFAIVSFSPAVMTTFYVDDASDVGDGWSPGAIGSNRKTGLGPTQPKAAIRALVLSYPMGTGGTPDNVWLDTGDYVHAVNLNLRRTPLSFDPRMNTVQAISIWGPANASAAPRINRANPYAGSVAIDMADAPDMRLRDIEVLGAYIGIRARNNSHNLIADQLILHDNAADGLAIEAGSDGAQLDVLQAYNNGRHGIFVDSLLDHIRQAEAYDNGQTGIALRSVGAAVIETSEVYCSLAPGKLCQTRGIDIINPGPAEAVVGHLDLVAARGNTVHHNAVEGIFASGNVLVAGSTVHDNNVYGVRLDDGADARHNVVHHHDFGISARGSTSDIVANRVYINDVTAIEASFDSNIQRNVVYTNQLHGIHGIEFSGLVDHNLVYSTGSNPVHIQGPGRGAEFINNTVYERCVELCPEVGVLVSTNSRDVDFRNNIIYIEGDATEDIPPEAISVNVEVRPDSIMGWDSDFNVLMTEHGMVGVFNGTSAIDIPAWQAVTGDDAFAINASLAGMWVDPDGADDVIGGMNGFDDNFHLSSTTSHATGGALAPIIDETAGGTGLPVFAPVIFGSGVVQSPAIDQGNPDFAYAVEPDVAPQENGQLRNAGAYGDTDQASSTPAQYVQVIYPLGTEDLAHGMTYEIRWRSHDDSANPTVTIELHLGTGAGAVEETIAVAAPNTGSFLWTVPEVGPAGEMSPGVPDGDYVIVVRRPVGPAGGGAEVVGMSRRAFTIGPLSNGPTVLRATPEPIEFATAITQFGVITLVYSDNMSAAAAADATNYELRWAGPNTVLDDGDDVTYTPAITYSSSGAAADIATAVLDFGPAAFPQGSYRFTVLPSVTSLAGIALDGDGDGVAGGSYVREFTVDQTPPTVSIVPVSPDPRNSAPLALNVVFSEPVIGFGLADVRLLLDRPLVDLGVTLGTLRNLFDAANSLIATSDGGVTWTISDVSRLMEEEGIYEFSLTAANSNIRDLAGNLLVVDAGESWEMDTTAPIADILAITPDPRSTAVSEATIVFDEPVFDFTFASLALSLAGQSVPLSAANNPTTTDNLTWTVPNLGSLTTAEGPYTLKVLTTGGLRDEAGNAPDFEIRETWLVHTTPPAADILDVLPDPRNTATGQITIVFDRPVLNVDLADLRLSRDGGANLLPGGATLTTSDNQYYTLGNLSGLTSDEGSYELRVVEAGSGIVDLAGNSMTSDAAETWAVDLTPPVVAIVPVAPDPRNLAVNELTIQFTTEVTGFDLSDLTLTRNGGANLLTVAQMLTTADGLTWTLGGLAGLTADDGTYLVTLVAAGSGIVDLAGNPLAEGASESWTVDTTPPTVDITDITPDPRTTAVDVVEIVFNEMVTGLDLGDLELRRDGGANLLSASQSLTTTDGITYTLENLAALTAMSGVYELSLGAFDSLIRDVAGNSLPAGSLDTWTTDATAPTVDIVDVAPDPRTSVVDSITLVFSEPVVGFDLADLSLTRNAGPNLLNAAQALVTSDDVTFTLGNLADLTAEPGDYVLTLAATGSGIADGLGNALPAGASETWRTVRVGDFNADFAVDGLDLHILQTHLGTSSGATHFDGDMNGDGAVGRVDAALFTTVFGQSSAAPPVPSPAASLSDQALAGERRMPAAWRLVAEARRPGRVATVLSSAAVDQVLQTSAISPPSSSFAGPALRARRHSIGTAQKAVPYSLTTAR
jgi:hypothetical protein